jgi:hypothetical protein
MKVFRVARILGGDLSCREAKGAGLCRPVRFWKRCLVLGLRRLAMKMLNMKTDMMKMMKIPNRQAFLIQVPRRRKKDRLGIVWFNNSVVVFFWHSFLYYVVLNPSNFAWFLEFFFYAYLFVTVNFASFSCGTLLSASTSLSLQPLPFAHSLLILH